MTTTTAARTSSPRPTVPGPTAAPTRAAGSRVRPLVGGFFLTMAGMQLGIVAAGPSAYRHFADAGPFGFVRTGWADVFMAAPAFWGLCLFAGEAALGTLVPMAVRDWPQLGATPGGRR